MSALHSIAYISIGYPLDQAGLIAMLESARCFNDQVGVTGVLFHHAGHYFQYFEGSEDAVRQVFHRIEQSPLHHDVRVLLDAPLRARHFASWHMGFCESPRSEFEAIANADWTRAMPLTRTTLERSESLALVLSYWSRWVADQPDTSTAES